MPAYREQTVGVTHEPNYSKQILFATPLISATVNFILI